MVNGLSGNNDSAEGAMLLDADHVRRILEQQFATLAIDRVVRLGEGYDSIAFLVDETWVFRFPKREDVEQQLLFELRVLPTIAAASPICIPEYQFVGEPSAAFPRHFGGYRCLPGIPANQVAFDAARLAQVAPRIGHFLSVLHGLERSPGGAVLPARPTGEVLLELQTEALDEVQRLDEISPADKAAQCRRFLERAPPLSFPDESAVVVHGDLAAEHVLIDPDSGRVTGIIDWSEIALSSAALDLAALFHWGGERFAEQTLEYYDRAVTAELLQQARFIAVCRAVLDVTFGLETGRAEYIAGAQRTLEFFRGGAS